MMTIPNLERHLANMARQQYLLQQDKKAVATYNELFYLVGEVNKTTKENK